MRNFVKISDVISTSSPPESLKKKTGRGNTLYMSSYSQKTMFSEIWCKRTKGSSQTNVLNFTSQISRI